MPVETMPYFPMIKNGRPLRRYKFGAYSALLMDEVESAQTVQYHFVFFVFQGDEKLPCLAVASEWSDEESKQTPFLGVFPGEGHLNLGASKKWLDFKVFAEAALETALAKLGLPKSTPVVSDSPYQKPWWKFW